MAREFFKNLPNTTTPLTAPRLNGLLDGDEAMGNIVVDSISSKNLISGWNSGGIDSTTGADTTSTASFRTNYMEVDFSSNNYYISGLPNSSYRHFVASYNANKQFLGRTGANIQGTRSLNSGSFTSGTPQGTGDIKYLKITVYDNVPEGNLKNAQLEKGSSATAYSPYQNLSGKDFYSTSESIVGTWINGKPIYRKVVTFNPRSDVMETSYNHGIANIDMILPTSSCILVRSTGSFVPFAMTYPSANSTNGIVQWSIGWQAGKTAINTWLGDNMRGQIDTTTYGYGAVAILEYTKTTD